MRTITKHSLFYHPYASFTNAQLPLLKVEARYFDKLVILDPGGSGRATRTGVGVDRAASKDVEEK